MFLRILNIGRRDAPHRHIKRVRPIARAIGDECEYQPTRFLQIIRLSDRVVLEINIVRAGPVVVEQDDMHLGGLAVHRHAFFYTDALDFFGGANLDTRRPQIFPVQHTVAPDVVGVVGSQQQMTVVRKAPALNSFT